MLVVARERKKTWTTCRVVLLFLNSIFCKVRDNVVKVLRRNPNKACETAGKFFTQAKQQESKLQKLLMLRKPLGWKGKAKQTLESCNLLHKKSAARWHVQSCFDSGEKLYDFRWSVDFKASRVIRGGGGSLGQEFTSCCRALKGLSTPIDWVRNLILNH